MINRLLFAGVLLIFVSCSNDIDKVQLLTDNTSLPVETGKNVFINYTDSGLLRARVFAPLMERYATDDRNETVMSKGLTVYFLDQNKKVQSFLKSKYAIRYDRERRMVAKNDVTLVNVKGDTLKTEVLNWDETSQKIYTDNYVRIITADNRITTAEGLESNTEFTKYKLKKIKGDWRLDQ